VPSEEESESPWQRAGSSREMERAIRMIARAILLPEEVCVLLPEPIVSAADCRGWSPPEV